MLTSDYLACGCPLPSPKGLLEKGQDLPLIHCCSLRSFLSCYLGLQGDQKVLEAARGAYEYFMARFLSSGFPASSTDAFLPVTRLHCPCCQQPEEVPRSPSPKQRERK